MNWIKLNLLGRGWVEHRFTTLVSGKIRERRLEERRLAEQRTLKHQVQAIKSCVADARNYRVARKLSAVATARFH
jgi:virulence-associated protein VapD